MTTRIAKLAGLALIAALCAGFTSGLTAPARAGWDEGVAAYDRGDYATALREWRPLAKQGNVKAQYILGVMYEKGQGVPQDYAEAVEWYRNAATSVNTRAQASLKVIHLERTSSPTDAQQSYFDQLRDNLGIRSWRSYLVEAYKWFEIIAPVLPSGRERDMIDKTRDDIAEEMTPAQIAEAQRLAREWRPK